MDAADRARADPRQPSFQRDRARAARASRARCSLSRLRDLEDRGVIQRLPGAQPNRVEYHLTDAGRDLKPVIEGSAHGVFAGRSASRSRRSSTPALLVWKMHQRIDRSLLPPGRTVVEFDFTGTRGRRVWLVLEPREVSVCVKPPRFDADLIVRADLAFFFRVWLGRSITPRPRDAAP